MTETTFEGFPNKEDMAENLRLLTYSREIPRTTKMHIDFELYQDGNSSWDILQLATFDTAQFSNKIVRTNIKDGVARMFDAQGIQVGTENMILPDLTRLSRKFRINTHYYE